MLAITSTPGLFGLIIPNLGVPELMIILGIAVLIFGGKKIPEVAKGLGQGIRQFKESLKSEEEEHAKKADPQATKSST